MSELMIWLAEADTDKVHAVEVFQTGENARKWCEEMRIIYNPELDNGKWFETERGGTWKQRGSMAEYAYELRKVQP